MSTTLQLMTLDRESVKDRDREVEVFVRIGPDSQLYRALCGHDPDVMIFSFAHEAAFVIAGIQNERMADWLEKHEAEPSSVRPFTRTPLAVIDSHELKRLRRLIKVEATLAELSLRSDPDGLSDCSPTLPDGKLKSRVLKYDLALDRFYEWWGDRTGNKQWQDFIDWSKGQPAADKKFKTLWEEIGRPSAAKLRTNNRAYLERKTVKQSAKCRKRL